jgi:hypothetical protein
VLLELTHRCAGEGEKVSWVPTGTVFSYQSVVPVTVSVPDPELPDPYYRRQEKGQKKVP